MTMSEKYRVEEKLLKEIENEKKFNLRKLVKMMQLNAVASSNIN